MKSVKTHFYCYLEFHLSICQTVSDQIIPLHSRDYLKKTSIKINVATDEGNSRNET